MKSLVHSSNVKVRQSGWFDRRYLYDIDVKCFDDVWFEESWLHWFKDDKCAFLAEVGGKPAGFAACLILRDGLFIEKLGVKPEFRRHGVSKELLSAIERRAQSQQWPHVVSLTVPETFLSPGKPDDISGWIKRVGFKAKPPLQPDFFNINGESIQGVPCLLED